MSGHAGRREPHLSTDDGSEVPLTGTGENRAGFCEGELMFFLCAKQRLIYGKSMVNNG